MTFVIMSKLPFDVSAEMEEKVNGLLDLNSISLADVFKRYGFPKAVAERKIAKSMNSTASELICFLETGGIVSRSGCWRSSVKICPEVALLVCFWMKAKRSSIYNRSNPQRRFPSISCFC